MQAPARGKRPESTETRSVASPAFPPLPAEARVTQPGPTSVHFQEKGAHPCGPSCGYPRGKRGHHSSLLPASFPPNVVFVSKNSGWIFWFVLMSYLPRCKKRKRGSRWLICSSLSVPFKTVVQGSKTSQHPPRAHPWSSHLAMLCDMSLETEVQAWGFPYPSKSTLQTCVLSLSVHHSFGGKS